METLSPETTWFKFYERMSTTLINCHFPSNWHNSPATNLRIRTHLEQSIPSSRSELQDAELHMRIFIHNKNTLLDIFSMRLAGQSLIDYALPMNPHLMTYSMYILGGTKIGDGTLSINPATPDCVVNQIINPMWAHYQQKFPSAQQSG